MPLVHLAKGQTTWIIPGSPDAMVALTTFHPIGAVALARVQTEQKHVFFILEDLAPAGHVPVCPLCAAAALLTTSDCVVAVSVFFTLSARSVLETIFYRSFSADAFTMMIMMMMTMTMMMTMMMIILPVFQ